MSMDKWKQEKAKKKEEKKKRDKIHKDQNYQVPNGFSNPLNKNTQNKPTHRISPRGG